MHTNTTKLGCDKFGPIKQPLRGLIISVISYSVCDMDTYAPAPRFLCELERMTHDRAHPVRGLFEMMALLTTMAQISSEAEVRHFLSRFMCGRPLLRRIQHPRKTRRRDLLRAEAERLRTGQPIRLSLAGLKVREYPDFYLWRSLDGLSACLRVASTEYDDAFRQWRNSSPCAREVLIAQPFVDRFAQWDGFDGDKSLQQPPELGK